MQTTVEAGQTWRLRTIDGPSLIRVDEVYRGAVAFTVLEGPTRPDARLGIRDLVGSPNAALIPTETKGPSDA